ncbi:MAG: hypothetical protein JKY51_01055, partial [Opitutaceae bacterium]|nr:hypothetical protein [Opitutaceae bacterium]
GNNYFLTYGKRIYRYNVEAKKLVKEYSFTKGRGPLQFCKIQSIEGFSDSICFGEYFGNHQRQSVKIMQRTANGKWESPFQFKENEINHVHALVPDSFNQCVWILVGDFGHSAAIYMAKNNFQSVKLVVSGKQIYRACVAFPTAKGLLYATDTQVENNSVRILKKNKGKWISEKLYSLNGSCIYGCELKDYYIFSTSTEPCENPKSTISGLLDNRPARGIKLNSSDIVSCDKKDNSFQIIASKRKDVFPYRIFQFGTIMFPSGKTAENLLFAYNVGSKKNDLSTEVYNLNF